MRLPEASWRALFDVAERTQSTTGLRLDDNAPQWLRDAVAERRAKVRARRPRLEQTYREVVSGLKSAGIDFVVLKGFTHEADAQWAPGERVQNDLDLFLRKQDVPRAEAALLQAGFVFHVGSELSDNHGRPMLKPHGWTWAGDYFDPELPVSVELHHTIWSFDRDRIETPGVDAFWQRREPFPMGGSCFRDADRIGIAALHLLRHILRNNVRPAHAYELARMVQDREDAVWKRWAEHPPELQMLESVAMQFAVTWFGGSLPDCVERAWQRIPVGAQRWFGANAFAPIDNLSEPNKNVLKLHWALLTNWRDRAAVARRRLLPMRLPGRKQAPANYWRHVSARGRYHAVALMRMVLGSGRAARSTASHTSD